MDGARSDPPLRPDNTQAASGGQLGVFARHALPLLENGYSPLPIRPGQKVPAVSRWSQVLINEEQVDAWSRKFPTAGIGLRTGFLVGLDIDLLDADSAHTVTALAQTRLGVTLIRVGLWLKQLLLYRTDSPFAKMKVGRIEVLGAGQQVVAFGRHPGTGRDYYWPDGDSPLDTAFDDLPSVDRDSCAAFLAEAAALLPAAPTPLTVASRARDPDAPGTASDAPGPGGASGVSRNPDGLVVDGRDSWLSSIAYHMVHDALNRGHDLGLERLAALVWERFAATTDLSRPRQHGHHFWSLRDARAKVANKLRLHGEGRLPPRELPADIPAPDVPTMGIGEARARLETLIKEACADILAWHRGDREAPLRIGLRATVGLGKTRTAMAALLQLRQDLWAQKLPDRILVFTPSHALAEEAATAWQKAGVTAAVLRGYKRNDPATGGAMCWELEAVDAALRSGLDVQSTLCETRGGDGCPHFAACPKQRNRAEVQRADVVIAPYDALYTGFAVDPATVGIIMIDEACWARAVDRQTGVTLDELGAIGADALGTGMDRNRNAAGIADTLADRRRLLEAFRQNGDGPVARSALVAAGLTAELCERVMQREKQALGDPDLRPDMPASHRKRAIAVSQHNEVVRRIVVLWRAIAQSLTGSKERDGRVSLATNVGGKTLVEVRSLRRVHPNFNDKPILHLDATLRPDIAGCILPGLAVHHVEAAASHMTLRQIGGPFGKSSLVPDPRASDEEIARRVHNLAACTDYVRWHARRLRSVLVVTYAAIEDAFAGIQGVATGHFNAIAGLDAYRDVRGLVVIGRPLPRDSDLAPLAAACFGHVPSGGYGRVAGAVPMRNGTGLMIRVTAHADPMVEPLRAAICDDEVMQAIGRGRGVNRMADTPLEVHLLADVALPLPHDHVGHWDMEAPDILQRMLLEGLATDSPADAARLHPGLLANDNQAKLAFNRAGFKGHFPIGNTYRGLTLKSAAYRRSGRGRSWQRCWWIDGMAEEALARLETALGPLAGWTPADVYGS